MVSGIADPDSSKLATQTIQKSMTWLDTGTTIARWVFGLASIALAVFAVVFAFKSNFQPMWAFSLLAALFFAGAMSHKIKDFYFGWKGVKLELQKFEIALNDLQKLSTSTARSILTVVVSSGRMGGIPDDKQDAIRARLVDALARIGIRDASDQIMAEVHEYTAFDYAHYILGGCMIPDRTDRALQQEWKELRSGGLNNPASPDQIKAFLTKHGCATSERLDRVEDYRYYLEHREHRRPNVWARREEWGQLD